VKKFKYNIAHRSTGKVERINFKTKDAMLSFLDKNKKKVNNLKSVALHLGEITLPLKVTPWFTTDV
jgi:hypothetical protein